MKYCDRHKKCIVATLSLLLQYVISAILHQVASLLFLLAYRAARLKARQFPAVSLQANYQCFAVEFPIGVEIDSISRFFYFYLVQRTQAV